MKSAVTRRNFATKFASMLSTLGIGAAVLGKTAAAQTSPAQDTGVQKLNYDGKPADGEAAAPEPDAAGDAEMPQDRKA